MRRLVTVAEAAVLVDRSPATIYRWKTQGRLLWDINRRGMLVVEYADVLKAAATTRQGRPVARSRET